MKYIECPEVYTGRKRSIFLAGGISSCYDWQQEMVKYLKITDLVILNPRRASFDINDKEMAKAQIKWEFDHLNSVNSILFWFSHETTQPITLFELGRWSFTDKPIYVGIDPEYERRSDVEIQMKLARPEVKITYNLKDLAQQVISQIR